MAALEIVLRLAKDFLPTIWISHPNCLGIEKRWHNKEFLLRFVRDRLGWIDLLYDIQNRFYLRVLNQMATSNPIL
jgi:hypothetical protein